jgi:polysaccharide deacetylase family protein (PEP-CTERM system associated)
MRNALTVDVEEYFHPSEIQLEVSPDTWGSLPSRVEANVDQTLEMLSRYGVSATFFILGWVAERHPAMVRSIASQGHEIGCHSYAHQLVYSLNPAAFRADTQRAAAAIADACGVQARVYRAPSYSINGRCLWAMEILIECGFDSDSSVVPVQHDRYGLPGFPRHMTVVETPSGCIREIPPGTVDLGNGIIAPVGGGGYLRLLPYRYTAAGIRHVNRVESEPVCVYFHPWELDAGQPRLASGLISRLRTYSGLKGMQAKISRLMQEFEFSTMRSVYGGLTGETSWSITAAGSTLPRRA